MQTLATCEGPQSPVLTSLREVPKRPRHFVYSSATVMPVTETVVVPDNDFGVTSSTSEGSDASFPPTGEQEERKHVLPASQSTLQTAQSHFENGNLAPGNSETQVSSQEYSPGHKTPIISQETLADTVESGVSNDTPQHAEQSTSSAETDVYPSSTTVSQSAASNLLPPCISQEAACSTCEALIEENSRLTRLVARLRMRVLEVRATSQTHGQRLLRAAYQDKIREMNNEHAQKTTDILNKQKACFEEELEALEKESHAAIHTLHIQLERERVEKDKLRRAFENERDEAIEKTNITMQAVQRKMAHLHAKVVRLERENAVLSASQKEKQVMVEVLASATAARDVERREREMLSKAEQEERNRKNMLIDSMNTEIQQLRARLLEETECRRTLLRKIEEMRDEREDEREKHAEDLADCKKQSQKESDRLGRLFASVIQDFANVPSDVSTND